MGIEVISLNRRLVRFEKPVVKILRGAAKILKLKNVAVGVYLTNRSVGRKKEFNVLSYPTAKSFPHPDLIKVRPLGEIYLNPEYIFRQQEDLTQMVIHGLLHLLGYDHLKKSDRIEMEKKEEKLYEQLHRRPRYRF